LNTVFKSINNIGIVVKDVDEVVKNFADNYGLGPWSIEDMGPENIKDMRIEGKKTDYRIRVAACNFGDVKFELIQPLDNISSEAKFLSRHGENLHHIGYAIENYEKTLGFLKDRGMSELQSGNFHGKNHFTYLNSESELKHIIKLEEKETGYFKNKTSKYGFSWATFPEPEKIYPSEKDQEKMMPPVLKELSQVSFIVKDVDAMVRLYNDVYGIGPWKTWIFSPETVDDMQIFGKNQGYKMRLALTLINGVEFELIQPLDDVSIYSKFLQEQGEGFHHLGYIVEEYDKKMEYMKSIGVRVSMSGAWLGKHSWVYLTTDKDLKHIVELNYNQPDFVQPEPLETYPA
jgi:catechol 2,3-dioxygenase-like lactoylglutathione lyase family enzyme